MSRPTLMTSTLLMLALAAPAAAAEPGVAELGPITADNVVDLAVIEEYPDYVWLAFTPDDSRIAMQGDKLALFDRASGEMTVLVDEVLDQNYATAISPDGRDILYVTTSDDGTPVSRVWDVEAGKIAVDMQSADAGAVFLPGSTELIVAGTELYRMDMSTGVAVDHAIESRSTSGVIDLMPDGTTLITSSNGFVIFDSTETDEEIKTWDFTEVVGDTTVAPDIAGVSVTQDGSVVAVGVGSVRHPELDAIHIMDYATDEPLLVIPYELGGEDLRDVAMSPDGSLLVAAYEVQGSWAGFLDAYDAASGELLTSIQVDGAVQRVRFSPDGALLAVGTTKRNGLQLYAVTQ